MKKKQIFFLVCICFCFLSSSYLIFKKNIPGLLIEKVVFECRKPLSNQGQDSYYYYIDGSVEGNLSEVYSIVVGSGTNSDPYVIKDIELSAYVDVILKLQFVNDIFHLVNVTIHGYENSTAIKIRNCENISIFNCTFESAKYGAHLVSSTNITIVNSTINDNQEVGIFIEHCNQLEIVHNYISSQNDGIMSTGSTAIYIIENIITENGRFGIYDSNSNYSPIIAGNSITKNEFGIILVNDYSINIVMNKLEQNRKLGIGIYSCEYANIDGNVITDSQIGIKIGTPWQNPPYFQYSTKYWSKMIQIYRNTIKDIKIKPILNGNHIIHSFQRAEKISLMYDNELEQNPWSVIIVILIGIGSISIVSFSLVLPIRKWHNLKKSIKEYKNSDNLQLRIEQLQKELQDYKKKFFNLESKLKEMNKD